MKKYSVLFVAVLLLIPGAFAATTENSVWPLSNSTTPDEITDVVGPRLLSGVYDYHRGLDFLAARGTPIVSVMDGKIVRMETAEENYGTSRERFGNWMFVNHSAWPGLPNESRMTCYMHMEGFAPTAYVGKSVQKGEVIGYVGDSGVGINTVHLHLELHKAVPNNYYSKDRTRNVMKVLPYTDSDIATVTTTESPAGNYIIKVVLPADDNELDFNRVEIYGSSGSRFVDFDTREGIDTSNNDNPTYNGVTIMPDNFWYNHAFYNMSYNVQSATIGTLQNVKAYDTHGNLLADVVYNVSEPDAVFFDGFDDFSQWTESVEYDWNVETPSEKQIPGYPSGNTVAHADNCDTGCVLTMTNPVDLSGYSSATLSFYRYIDNDLDKKEYLEVEAYDGSSWNQIYYWSNGGSDDDTWHLEEWSIPAAYRNANFKVRFTTKESTTSEDVELDDVKVVAE